MRVMGWRIFNPKTNLFWSNNTGWGSEDGCTDFDEMERSNTPHIPLDGIWVPYIVAPCVSTDDLIGALKLFPVGTRLTGYGDHAGVKYNSAKVFGTVLDRETREDAEGDENPNAALFAVVAFF